MSKGYHKFEENIMKLSQTKDIENLHEEWVSLAYDEHVINPETCICNREIGNVHRFLNMKTMKMINVGTNCVKKLRLKKCQSVRIVMNSFIGGVRGNYNQICDLIKYSNENWLTFLEAIKIRANSDWDNLIGLTEINKIMSILSENGIECAELHILVSEIQKRLDEKAELAELARKFAEKVEKQAEAERIQKYNKKYKDNIRQYRLKQEQEIQKQRLLRQERERKQKVELEILLEENAKKERERVFREKKSAFGQGIRETVRKQVPRCEKCNILQRCVYCSFKITKEVTRQLEDMVNSEFV